MRQIFLVMISFFYLLHLQYLYVSNLKCVVFNFFNDSFYKTFCFSNLLAFLLLIGLCLLEVFNIVKSVEGAFSITGVNIGVSEKSFTETVKLRSTSSNDSTFYFIRVFIHVDFIFYFLVYDESINVIL